MTRCIRSPIDKRQWCLCFIDRVFELDKLNTSITAAPVEVRDLHVESERTRYRGHLDMVCKKKNPLFSAPSPSPGAENESVCNGKGLTRFLSQNFDERFTKLPHLHFLACIGMEQEGIVFLWVATNLCAGNHTHEHDQIIGHWREKQLKNCVI
jgi:hypothetical protein